MLDQENENDETMDDLDTERTKRGRARSASPPPVVERQNHLLYGTEAPEYVEEASPPIPSSSSSPLINLGLNRLVARLQDRPRELKIVINDVGVRLPVIGWDLQPRALLCFVTGDVSCDLPLTQNVKVYLNGDVLAATFVGQWHKMDWLPFQVVAFVIPESEGS